MRKPPRRQANSNAGKPVPRSLSGIAAVESFNERQVNIKRRSAIYNLRENLTVSKFNTERHAAIEGNITEHQYAEKGRRRGYKKLFK